MATNNAKLSQKRKELGRAHRARVAALKRAHVAQGLVTPCWWCGEPMLDMDDVDGDHSKSRSLHKGTVADRLLHSRCNRQRGDGSKDHLRPALTKMERFGGCAGNVFSWPVLPGMEGIRQ